MAGLFKVIISGTTPAAGEVWSVGLHYIADDDTVGFAELQRWATATGVAIAGTVGNTLFNALSSQGAINKVRVEERSATDDTLVLAAEYVLPTPRAGTNTPDKVLQAAACISLLSGQPGRSYRGRIYWPTWIFAQDLSLQFSSATRTSWLTAFVAINNLIITAAANGSPAFIVELIVRSKLLHVSNRVQSVAIGSVPDVQRRRRDALTETYSAVTV